MSYSFMFDLRQVIAQVGVLEVISSAMCVIGSRVSFNTLTKCLGT